MDFEEWFDGYHSNNEAYAEMIAKDAFEAGQKSKQAEIDALKKIKVVHGGDFRDRWEGVYITEDQFNYCYDTSDSEDIAEQLLFNEFECHGFSFDSDIHEEI